MTIPPFSKASVSTGLILQLPDGIYGDLKGRSGLAKKKNITIHHGTLDPDYRGVLHILVYNHSASTFQIEPGDRIAQLVFTLYATPNIITSSHTTPTKRGMGGFGSTGIKHHQIVPTPEQNNTIQCNNASHASQYLPALKHLQQQPIPSIFQHKVKFNKNNNINPKSSNLTSQPPDIHVIPSDEASIQTASTEDITDDESVIEIINNNATDSTIDSSNITESSNSDTSLTTSKLTPSIRPVDRASSTSRKLVHLSSENLHQHFGFRNIDNLLKHLPTLAQPNVKLQRTSDDVLEATGKFSTIHKSKSNKTPTDKGTHFGQTINMDIGYGSHTAIGGIKYCLFLVDRFSRQKYVYPLTDLSGSTISTQLQQFFMDIGGTPKRILCDCDKKLLQGNVAELLRKEKVLLASAPRDRQNQNGLAERNWYTCVRMARSWLSASALPPKFWYHAIKRAAEIANYFPIKHGSTITTPFELAHGVKPDFRTLFPMFSLAYVRQTTDPTSNSTSHREKFTNQSIKCIAIGRDPLSDGLLFYNPRSNRTISSSDYRLDPTKPSGIAFKYDPPDSFHFHLHDKNVDINRPPEFDLGQIILLNLPDNNINEEKGVVIGIPLVDDQPYAIQSLQDQAIYHALPNEMSPLPPSSTTTDIEDAPSWIKNNCKCTLYIPNKMPKPIQGKLIYTDSNEWQFSPGRKTPSNKPPIPLPDFEQGYARRLTTSKQLMSGWQRRAYIMQQQHLHRSTNIHALHVSATKLLNHQAP